jgi:hypothetical protein
MFQRVISSTVAIAFVIVSLGLSGCGKGDRITIQGGRSSNDYLSISSGNLVIKAGQPGVLFGTANATNRPVQFGYVVVFKHAGLKPFLGDTYKARNSTDGKKGVSTCTLGENGTTIQVDYEIELDDKGEVAEEALNVGGKVVDLAAGRLFLIDLTSPPPTYEQKKSDQLGVIKSLATTEDVDQVAASILDTLK